MIQVEAIKCLNACLQQFYILSERRYFPHSCLQLQPVKTFTKTQMIL